MLNITKNGENVKSMLSIGRSLLIVMLPNCHYNIPITIIITESASPSYCYAPDAWPVFPVIVKLCFTCYVLRSEQLIYLNKRLLFLHISIHGSATLHQRAR